MFVKVNEKIEGIVYSGFHTIRDEARLRQAANVSFKLRISQNQKKADKNCPEQFFHKKLA